MTTSATPTGPNDWRRHPGADNIWVFGTGPGAIAIGASSAASAHLQYLEQQQYAQQQQAAENARQLAKVKKYPELEITVRPVKRRVTQPRFWMPYDTLTDAVRRLGSSIVYIGAYPYYIHHLAEDAPGQYVASVMDDEEKMYHVYLDNPHVDLRSFEPQYITVNSNAAWLFRWPSRHQKQGADNANIGIMYAGKQESSRVPEIIPVLRHLKYSENLEWSETFQRLLLQKQVLSALRLTPQIAVYRQRIVEKRGDSPKFELKVEYKGRAIGTLCDDTVLTEEERPWIIEAVKEAGCKVQHATS